MLTVQTSQSNYLTFLSLTGHAFDQSSLDSGRAHGFYWSMRWLARQILGNDWMNWLIQLD